MNSIINGLTSGVSTVFPYVAGAAAFVAAAEAGLGKKVFFGKYIPALVSMPMAGRVLTSAVLGGVSAYSLAGFNAFNYFPSLRK